MNRHSEDVRIDSIGRLGRSRRDRRRRREMDLTRERSSEKESSLQHREDRCLDRFVLASRFRSWSNACPCRRECRFSSLSRQWNTSNHIEIRWTFFHSRLVNRSVSNRFRRIRNHISRLSIGRSSSSADQFPPERIHRLCPKGFHVRLFALNKFVFIRLFSQTQILPPECYVYSSWSDPWKEQLLVISSVEHSQTIELNVNETRRRSRWGLELFFQSMCGILAKTDEETIYYSIELNELQRVIVFSNDQSLIDSISKVCSSFSSGTSPRVWWLSFRSLLVWMIPSKTTLNCPFVIFPCRSSMISIEKIWSTSPSILRERFGSNENNFIFDRSNEISIDRSKTSIRSIWTNTKNNINWTLHRSEWINERETEVRRLDCSRWDSWAIGGRNCRMRRKRRRNEDEWRWRDNHWMDSGLVSLVLARFLVFIFDWINFKWTINFISRPFPFSSNRLFPKQRTQTFVRNISSSSSSFLIDLFSRSTVDWIECSQRSNNNKSECHSHQVKDLCFLFGKGFVRLDISNYWFKNSPCRSIKHWSWRS